MSINHPRYLTVHHTATKQNFGATLKTKLRSLQAFSQSSSRLADGRTKKPWGDVPYHFYIDAEGGIGEGRDLRFAGDTNTEYDPNGHIGIVVEGNFETDRPTPDQIEALEDLLVYLAQKYAISTDDIGTHQDFAHTACPGRNLQKLMPAIKAHVASRLGNK